MLCLKCNQLADINSFEVTCNVATYHLSCGDMLIKDFCRGGDRPFGFQISGINFGLDSRQYNDGNVRVLIADEMGLGKTIQALGIIHNLGLNHRVLWITRSSIAYQSAREVISWLGCVPELSNTTNPAANPNFFPINIVSVDSLAKLLPIYKGKYDVVVIDECQAIKNFSAKRTQAVRAVCKDAKHIIGLSGTPIHNNAAEYYSILHILQPERFKSEESFIRNFVNYYHDGYKFRYGGIKQSARSYFDEITKNLILRRTRKEVLPDLPKIQRNPLFVEFDRSLEAQYALAVQGFEECFDSDSSQARDMNILAWMTKMRKLAGISKVPVTVEQIQEAVESGIQKLTVFVHHHDVHLLLRKQLSALGVKFISFEASDSQYEKDMKIGMFEKQDYPVLIIPTQAGGIGLNLQFCSNCIFVEREWSPVHEEQAEGRFSRIGSEATHISATYITAVGTIDEIFLELVERKRAVLANTMDKTESDDAWAEHSMVKELADALRSSGRKAFQKVRKNA